ncbi:MAG: hypothetical protein KBE23_12795 [Chloroflexi bacterium]|nr:hypothetical protein [Chloroflexota bacterium]MBP7043616.1 hypothetical protein [Chloroflexota bacterium]
MRPKGWKHSPRFAMIWKRPFPLPQKHPHQDPLKRVLVPDFAAGRGSRKTG